MPKATAKSSLGKKAFNRLDAVISAHKDDETKVRGGGRLPAGISRGVAELTECKIRIFEKREGSKNPHVGEPYFYAVGTVKTPQECEGLRTSIIEAICDTPEREWKGARTTADENLAEVLNMLRCLGADTSELSDMASLEALCESMESAGIHFTFSTVAGKKNPDKVYENWHSAIDYSEESGNGVVDQTATEKPKKGKSAPVEAQDADEEEEPEDEDAAEDEDEDLDALARKADKDDEDAQNRLSELAKAASVKGVDKMPTWKAVAKALQKAQEASEDEDEGDDASEGETPKKGQVVGYKPPKSRKPIDCDVIAVFPDRQTVNLKSLEDGKTQYKQIDWADLSEPS